MYVPTHHSLLDFILTILCVLYNLQHPLLHMSEFSLFLWGFR